jgi:Ca2+-transporting ATPase
MTRLKLAPQAEHVGPAPPATVGLSSAEAQRRLTEFGPNEIRREQATKALTLLVRQFASPVIWLLLVATVLSAALGEWLDAIAIGAIVILNAIIGFFQEHRAQRAVMALRSMTAPRARVMREGHSVMMPANAIATTPNGARAHLLETLGNRTLIERRRRERRR